MIHVLLVNGNMRKRIKKVDIVVYDNKVNRHTMSEVLSLCLGYEHTQAYMCAMLVHARGEYLVKTYKVKDIDAARSIVSLMMEKGLDVKLHFN